MSPRAAETARVAVAAFVDRHDEKLLFRISGIVES
jgi:hypothetical protein